MPTILNERMTPRASSLILLTAILWGGNAVSIKIALLGMPPLGLAGVRFLIGGLVVLAYAVAANVSLRLARGEHKAMAWLVFLFLMQITLLNEGTHYTLATRSTVLISVYPFFTALFAHLFIPGDRLSRLKVLGMVLSFAGIVVIFAESLEIGELSHIPGDLMVLVSGVLLGARQVYTKRLTQGIHPYKLLVWQAALSLPVFGLLAGLFERDETYRFTIDVVTAILYQGIVVAGFCFVVFVSLLRRHSATSLGVFGFATPVFGVLASHVLLHEELSPALLVSMVLVGAGIAIVNWQQDGTPPNSKSIAHPRDQRYPHK